MSEKGMDIASLAKLELEESDVLEPKSVRYVVRWFAPQPSFTSAGVGSGAKETDWPTAERAKLEALRLVVVDKVASVKIFRREVYEIDCQEMTLEKAQAILK